MTSECEFTNHSHSSASACRFLEANQTLVFLRPASLDAFCGTALKDAKVEKSLHALPASLEMTSECGFIISHNVHASACPFLWACQPAAVGAASIAINHSLASLNTCLGKMPHGSICKCLHFAKCTVIRAAASMNTWQAGVSAAQGALLFPG